MLWTIALENNVCPQRSRPWHTWVKFSIPGLKELGHSYSWQKKVIRNPWVLEKWNVEYLIRYSWHGFLRRWSVTAGINAKKRLFYSFSRWQKGISLISQWKKTYIDYNLRCFGMDHVTSKSQTVSKKFGSIIKTLKPKNITHLPFFFD